MATSRMRIDEEDLMTIPMDPWDYVRGDPFLFSLGSDQLAHLKRLFEDLRLMDVDG